jgi:Asp-tRNA(Asn)/Glu-tRNA(Gln) amidotransferase A subunit family amidase
MNAKKQILLFLVLSMLTACHDSSSVNESSPLSDSELRSMTAHQILPSLKSGEIAVSDYMEALLAQTAKYDDALNAFITIDPQAVREQAKRADAKRESDVQLGPLFGIPISLKDLIVTKDMPTTFGTSKFAGFMSSKNAPLVDQLIAADAIIFGKNNAQEWAFGSTGYNSHYGQQFNPYDRARIAGGSSGGGAAAVAARILPIAMGTDTVASIRVPAAYTGLYGLRPSTGRYDNSGIAPLATSLDTVGPMTRSVQDMALIDSVLSGELDALANIDLTQLRLGVPKAFFHAGLSLEMLSEFNAVLDRLRAAGVTLVEADLPDAQLLTDSGLYPILFFETYPGVKKFLHDWGNGTTIDELHSAFGPDVKAMWDDLVMPGAPNAISVDVYRAAIERSLPNMQSSYTVYFEEHNVSAIIFPATASEAPLATPINPQQTIIDGQTVSIFINDHNSSPGALAGQPGVVLPMALSAVGLPLGVSLDGKRGSDRELLAIAAAIDVLIPPISPPNLD